MSFSSLVSARLGRDSRLLSVSMISDCGFNWTYTYYSKTCLKWPLKIDKTKILKTNGSLMKVENIAECSLGAF